MMQNWKSWRTWGNDKVYLCISEADHWAIAEQAVYIFSKIGFQLCHAGLDPAFKKTHMLRSFWIPGQARNDKTAVCVRFFNY